MMQKKIMFLSYRNFNRPLDKEISAFGRNSDGPYPSGKRLDEIGGFRYDPALWKKGCPKEDSARGVSRVPIWFLIFLGLFVFLGDDTFAAVKINITAFNPSSDKFQEIDVKSYLPKELMPENIIDSGGLELNYDFWRNLYYLEKKVVGLKPKQQLTVTAQIEDIWLLKDKEIDFIRKYTQALVTLLKDSFSPELVQSLGENIERRLEKILLEQEKVSQGVDERMEVYKQNLSILALLNKDIDSLEELAVKSGMMPDELKEGSKFLMGLEEVEYFLKQGDVLVGLSLEIENPSDTNELNSVFSYYLPVEVKPEDVVDKAGFELEFDLGNSSYYLHKTVTLKPKEKQVYEVKLKNIWRIDLDKLTPLEEYAGKIFGRLKESEYYSLGLLLYQDIDKTIGLIKQTQEQSQGLERQIGAYRANLKRLAEIKEDIRRLEKLSLQIQKTDLVGEKFKVFKNVARALFGGRLPAPQMIWRVIWMIIIFLGIFSGLFYILQYTHQKMVVIDGVTGGFSRSYGMELLKQELIKAKRTKQKCSVVMLDLDHFKQINDQYGHATGDTVLRNTAEMIKRFLEKKDIFVRHGGEEFFVILPETNKENAVSLAKKLRIEFEHKGVELIEKRIPLTLSFGVVTFPEDGESVLDLMGQSDEALYKAKQGGRNRVAVPGMVLS